MKTLAVLLPLAFTFGSHLGIAQECVKGTDPFDPVPVASFEWKAGGIRTLLFESRAGKSTLEIRLGEVGAVDAVIPSGSELLIKLENGDVVKLYTSRESKSVVSSTTIDASNNVTSSTYFLKMDITTDQLKQLAKFKVTHLRVPDLHGGFQTFGSKELRNKFEKFLFDGAKCLTE